MKTVGVNRASVRIHLSGLAGDSGRDTFTKKKMKSKQKELNEHLGTGSDPPIRSDRKGVLQGPLNIEFHYCLNLKEIWKYLWKTFLFSFDYSFNEFF